MRIVFMGTPDFAVPTLQALLASEHDVTAVITQPDKPKGRGKELQSPPVKLAALKAGIPVFQPAKVRLHQCTCFTASKVQRSRADTVRCDPWREKEWCDSDADG